MVAEGILDRVAENLLLHDRDYGAVRRVVRGLAGLASRPVGTSLLRWASDNLAHRVKAAAVQSVRSFGGRVYSKYSYVSEDGRAVAIVKFSVPWGSPPYRIVVVHGDMARAGGRLRRRAVLAGFSLSYLAVPDRAWSRLDVLKPRYRRSRPARGVVVRAFWGGDDSFPAGRAGVECFGAVGVFEEYRAKYAVFIPPLILWNFSRWVKFEPYKLYEVEECGGIESWLVGEA